MKESEWIAMFASVFGLRAWEADAEACPPAAGVPCVSVDSFSEAEDGLAANAPEEAGMWMAQGACADVLACGARPQWLLSAWLIEEARGIDFYRRVSVGVQRVLAHYGARCLGGDIGMAAQWCWMATVGGSTAAPVRRVASRRVPFALYASGPLGAANLALASRRPQPVHPLREPVPSEALFATDTSGGCFDALENFRRVNRGLRLRLDCAAALGALAASALSGVPSEVLLLGGAGESELLYALPTETPPPLGALRIGEGDFTDAAECEITFRTLDGRLGRFAPPPDYRALPPKAWHAATLKAYQEMLR